MDKSIGLFLAILCLFPLTIQAQVVFKDKTRIKALQIEKLGIATPAATELEEMHLKVRVNFYDALEFVFENRLKPKLEYFDENYPSEYYESISNKDLCSSYKVDAILYTNVGTIDRKTYSHNYTLMDMSSHPQVLMRVENCSGDTLLIANKILNQRIKLEQGERNRSVYEASVNCIVRVLAKLKF